MPDLSKILYIAFLIFLVVMSFNVIIFVHELGHFLAAKWRGLQVDRFQVWFGKPIWKKTIKGVQYGLGWIPAGGFVALPQMAPMESIEGKNMDGKPLPPIKPLDKIIVAFAGPLFSMLLALAAACVVSAIGKPTDLLTSTRVGFVAKGSPAEKAGLLPGDQILQVNGEDVSVFRGKLDGIFERIVLSKGDEIVLTIRRDGVEAPINLTTKFEIQPTAWYQRRAMRRIGVGPETDFVQVATVIENSPAARAGLKADDRILKYNDTPVTTSTQLEALQNAAGTEPFTLQYQRQVEGAPGTWGPPLTATIQAEVPQSPPQSPPSIGLETGDMPHFFSELQYVSPLAQIKDSLNMMWVTLDRLISRNSSVNLDHLNGPVGIAKVQYTMLQMDFPFHRLLAFFVLFNVNLAVLNMLPLPVLDGGHIVMASMEAITRRPMRARFLEVIQTGFALALISLMLYITSKDLFGDIGTDEPQAEEKIIFEKR